MSTSFSKKSYGLIFSLFILTKIFALPDLTITAISMNKPTITRGDYVIVNATIKNIGTTTAIPSFAIVYIEGITLARLATKQLAPNETMVLQYVFPIPLYAASGQHIVQVTVDFGNLVAESNENNNVFCPGTGSCQKLTVLSDTYIADRKLPCPIIFIHGLQSNDQTWYPFTDKIALKYGLSHGGNFDFCLNPDGDNSTGDSRTSIQTTGNFQSRLPARNGDYYFVNFDITRNGVLYPSFQGLSANYALSNQSAIYKQGFALQSVIQKVLEVSGAKEVILMGHSMGGLAARQYIQDKTNWQADGKHHVAKLVTVGTPHGGSNLAGGALSRWFLGIDEKSEAVRDLRHPNFSSRFLFGDSENGITEGYYNRDVNCNGSAGDNIVGLNYKDFPDSIAIACVIGKGIQSICSNTTRGDFVVCEDRADINQYQRQAKKAFADTFLIRSDELLLDLGVDRAFHNNLHGFGGGINLPTLMQALDEPKTYDKAYDIPINMAFFGTITMQAGNDPFLEPQKSTDYDDYRFTLETRSTIQVIAANISVQRFNLYLLNANQQVLYTIPSGGNSNINSTVTLDAGTYFLEVEATPDIGSWEYPYLLGVLATPVAGPVAAFTTTVRQGCSPLSVTYGNQSTGSPTSYQWTFQGGVPSTSTDASPTVSYATNGTYNVTLTVKNGAGTNTITRNGYIAVGRVPISSFSYSNLATTNPLTANFYNTSIVGVDAQYLWNFGDGTTSSETSPQHTYTRYGSFTVTLTVTNACGTKTATQTLSFRTPTVELSEKMIFEITPNPNDGRFVLTFKESSADLGAFKLMVFNTLGQPVYQGSIDATPSVSYPLSIDLPNGTYIATLSNDKGKSYRTFVVQR